MTTVCLVIAVDDDSCSDMLDRERTDVLALHTTYWTGGAFFPTLTADQMAVTTLLQLPSNLAAARTLDGLFDAHTKVGFQVVVVRRRSIRAHSHLVALANRSLLIRDSHGVVVRVSVSPRASKS